MDWYAWHRRYEDPDSGLGQRMALVQGQVSAALDRLPPGPIRAISICAGQGHDLIGALAGHERGGDVQARLVELDPRNVVAAQGVARAAGLETVDVVAGDASLGRAYVGAVPANIVLVCGVFGNISRRDIRHTIASLPQLCADGAIVIWTRHRLQFDITPTIRQWFVESGFRELAFETDRSGRFAVGMQRFVEEPTELNEGNRLFTFVGSWQAALNG